jgi:hypothetical protein
VKADGFAKSLLLNVVDKRLFTVLSKLDTGCQMLAACQVFEVGGPIRLRLKAGGYRICDSGYGGSFLNFRHFRHFSSL